MAKGIDSTVQSISIAYSYGDQASAVWNPSIVPSFATVYHGSVVLEIPKYNDIVLPVGHLPLSIFGLSRPVLQGVGSPTVWIPSQAYESIPYMHKECERSRCH